MLPLAPAPLAGQPESPSRPRRRRWVAPVVALGLLVSAVIGAAVVPVPYVALKPGSARPVSDQVLVEGAPSYPPRSSVAFTTVSLGSTTLLEALAGWLDDEVDVLPEEAVRGGRSEEENRRYNAELMDSSKHVAIAVALERLGHDVDITTSGTVVRDILPDSPAADALELDDVIVAVDGEPVDEPGEIGELLQPGGPGGAHVLTVERPAGSDRRLDLEVVTVPADDDPTRAIIGISAEDRITAFDFPVDVTIDSGRVGGPSAGLAFALAVIDVLTPGELTGGNRVAVTGTIDLTGRVGRVGGGAQKAAAVRDAGYDVFLVPTDEVDEVREVLGDRVRVVPVGTLDEALEALDSLGGNAGSVLAAQSAGP